MVENKKSQSLEHGNEKKEHGYFILPFQYFKLLVLYSLLEGFYFGIESSSNKNINVKKFLNIKINAQFWLEQDLQKQLQPHGGMN